jgi:guanine nucleotide-binding protein subunit alpha
MCFGGSADKEDVEGANKSREIDKLIRQDEKKMSREVKLLLLGEPCFPLKRTPTILRLSSC